MDGLSFDKTDAMDDIAESREDVAPVSSNSERGLTDVVGCCILGDSVASRIMTGEDDAIWPPRTSGREEELTELDVGFTALVA